MSAKDVSSMLDQEEVSTSGHGTVPVDHLDYGYIEKCTNVKYLEKILKILRSGDEGIYPHLTQFCENHLEKLDPKSRSLRKENPVATAASLSTDEWNQITVEMKAWEKEAKGVEGELKKQSLCLSDIENFPPVRGSNCSLPLSQTAVSKGLRKSSKNSAPRDYRDWDKFDVDKECDKVDSNVTKASPAMINSEHPQIKTNLNATGLTDQEKVLHASREKDKGNEAFRANAFEEAVAFYTRSVSLAPTVAAYNNRAQAEIKLQHWHNALRDSQKVLEMEPSNMKALLRRATVEKQLGRYQQAAWNLRTVLQAEPHNLVASKLLIEVDKKIHDSTGDRPGKGKRMLIQEVEEEVEDGARPVEPSQSVGGERTAAPDERGDMGNAQKKPHGRGDAAPHGEANSSHGHWRGRGGSADKYKVAGQEATDKAQTNGAQGGRRGTAEQVSSKAAGPAASPAGGEGGSNLDAPAGALPPPLARLKNEGNLLFKNGQFADALEKYSLAITGFTDSGIDSPEDMCILYSNRAACYLKDGNSQDCIQDCTKALELHPFSLKPLLRRAMAYETLERYSKAYVDYKTVLQIDNGVQAAHDSVNRITRLLIEQDGSEWRGNLPEIPLVPLSAQQHRREEPPNAELLQARSEKAAQDAARRAEVRFNTLKQEGNEFVKRGQFPEALGKYSECLKLKPDECAIYTNRALCYLKVERFAEAKQDCDSAIRLEPTNKKAFYRRAMANKGLKDYLACSGDLQEVLQLDPKVQEAETELEEVTVLLRQSLAAGSPAKPRKPVAITEVDGEEERIGGAATDGDASVAMDNRCGAMDGVAINLQPANAYEFGQSLNAARATGDTAACAELLTHVPPESLPVYLSSQLDAASIHFIMQALDTHLLQTKPDLVYQHLSQLHKTERFSVVLMLLEQSEQRHMTQLFERLSAKEGTAFTRNDVQNLANMYI
ncbi:sperm-associated antigen 1 [Osmerus eperlanus]|uniref:sperm-associated antigen 1 n=1 Tax=Osmerus eperlanus TaxID=29151 RepID=UPI002E0FF282